MMNLSRALCPLFNALARRKNVTIVLEPCMKGRGINSGDALQPFLSTAHKVEKLSYRVACDSGGYVAFVIVFQLTKAFSSSQAITHLKNYGSHILLEI